MRERAQSGRVTQICHNSPDEKRGIASANDVTHRKRAEDFGNLEKVRELRPASAEDGCRTTLRGGR